MQMTLNIDNPQRLSTAEVARLAGVHKDTLLRWLRAGSIKEPRRDRHGWRYFTSIEAENIRLFAQSLGEIPPIYDERPSVASPHLGNLNTIDWDFSGAKTNYLTHGIHPYPAKFIPQIPNALIQELSGVGDTIGDIFCGSGTTLVEALTLKRHAVGIDANPLACLITKVKTTSLTDEETRHLSTLADEIRALGEAIDETAKSPLLSAEIFKSNEWRPPYDKLEFWFQTEVIEELAEIKGRCMALPTQNCQNLALVALSSIVVSVSRQDSDTRYVRREKGIAPGETSKKFARALDQTLHAAVDFTELVEPRFNCSLIESSLLQSPKIPRLDLVVCSPPYPNAYSYHLYHMTRMLWLNMDQPKFKKEEIGSHRKYSSKSRNAATIETFRGEFSGIFTWLSGYLKPGGFACFVVGDSTLRGERVNNADLISAVGSTAGFREVARLSRNMQSTKKAFNPAIGKIKTEDILILENRAQK